jgi:nucleoporin NUP1
LENAREPPIAVLPFSIAKSTTEPARQLPLNIPSSELQKQMAPRNHQLLFQSQPSKLPVPVISSVPISEPKPTSGPLILPASAPTSSGNGNIPNFFASSQFLAKAPTPPVPVPVLNFTASPTHTEQAPLAPRPVKDAENPFWDGEKDSKRSDDKSAQNILPALEKTGSQTGSALAPVLLVSLIRGRCPPTTALPFSFNKPTEAKPEAPNFGSTTMVELKQPFSFPAPSKPASLDDAAQSGGNVPSSIPPSFLGEVPKLLGKPANSTSTFGQVVPPQSSPSPLSFTFGSQSPSKTEPKATFVGSESTPGLESTRSLTLEAPKPSFGGINGGKIFSFDQTRDKRTEQDATKLAPFSFSTTSPAPVVAPKPVEEPKPVAELKPVFPFCQPSGTTAGAVSSSLVTFGFSSGGSTSADVSTRQSFIFGQHNVVAPTGKTCHTA